MNEKKQTETQTQPAKKRRAPHAIAVFGNPRALCLAALLAAMSLILGKFMQIPTPVSELVRISFENMPVILAGMLMGPLAGAMTGAVADLVGCLAYGYTINPIVTLGAAAVGLIAGTVGLLFSRSTLLLRVSLCTVPAHLVGSVLIKTAGLAAWYLASYEIGYVQLLLWRLLNYAIIAALEIALLYFLLHHRGVSRQLERMCKK